MLFALLALRTIFPRISTDSKRTPKIVYSSKNDNKESENSFRLVKVIKPITKVTRTLATDNENEDEEEFEIEYVLEEAPELGENKFRLKKLFKKLGKIVKVVVKVVKIGSKIISVLNNDDASTPLVTVNENLCKPCSALRSSKKLKHIIKCPAVCYTK
ncbi:hypothetical protein GPJ56_006279 [Histomonas meleagridis]|uniref:uncharacterized protein n=1 Tax=Histomonas meleagridis TaxID=135588 RepID=UPI00355977E4|nr:hypothetical protein GPJ56_006279 [Histomonas meleagridis]KAH0796905.1 hypothetical protein GO595_010798 [Histomonas meleagridis]